MNNVTISEIMNGPWRERAIYTAEERGIPSIADGLKPVQRYLICKALKVAKTKFEKVATISTIATEGYHHGEASAAAALIGMAADFSNNLPVFEGDGNFGNVLDPAAGAPRYIYARLAGYFDALYKDMDLCPKHDDPDHIPPKYYLPIIPMVLVNGIKGIATGYSTDIPPHCPLSIISWLVNRAKGKKCANIMPKYYKFSGTVTAENVYYGISGVYETPSPIKIRIKELPVGYTCASYNAHLKKLLDKGTIVDYENNSRMNKFDYVVTLKRGTRWNDSQIRKNLKLDTTHTWNLTTVSIDGKIQEWDKLTGINDIMEAFYQFRLPYVAKRIENIINDLQEKQQYLIALERFCNDVINEVFSFKNISEETFKNVLLANYSVPEGRISQVINMPVRMFTTQMLEKLKEDLDKTEKLLHYYLHETTPEQEYINDLTELKNAIIAYEKENK